MRLRLITWNIHKGIGGVDRRYRPARIVEVLRHYAPDLLLLQEVDEGVPRSRLDRQAELVAGELGFAHVAFFPNVKVRGGGAYGNAVVSRHAIAAARNICLTYPGFKRRSVIHAVVHAEIVVDQKRARMAALAVVVDSRDADATVGHQPLPFFSETIVIDADPGGGKGCQRLTDLRRVVTLIGCRPQRDQCNAALTKAGHQAVRQRARQEHRLHAARHQRHREREAAHRMAKADLGVMAQQPAPAQPAAQVPTAQVPTAAAQPPAAETQPAQPAPAQGE